MNASSPDFPHWLPSALVKELRQGLRTPSFSLLACIFPALLALLFLFSFLEDRQGDALVAHDTCGHLLWVTLSLLLLLVIPVRAITSVRMELLSRNHELLLLTRQTAGRIVLGKWASFMAQSLLIVCISLPFFIIRYYYGQIDLVGDLVTLAALYLASAILTAFALWAAGQPPLLQIIAIVAMTFALMSGTSLLSEYDDFWGGMLTTGLILADTALVVATLLLQARSYFAPAAVNSCAAIRQLLAAFFAANVLFALFLGGHEEFAESVIQPQTYFLMCYGAIFLVIHLNAPAELLPVHVEQMAGKRFSLPRQMLFLPGLPSGVLFTLTIVAMAMALAVAAVFLPAWLSGGSEESFSKWNAHSSFLLCLAVAAWYALVAPALALWPFRRKLKQYILLAYMFLWVLILLLLSALKALELTLPAVPGSDLIRLIGMLDSDLPEALPDGTVVIAVINFVLVVAMLFLLTRSWFSVRYKAAAHAGTPAPSRPHDAPPTQL